MLFYLDCYYYGALLGDQFPVNTYGPATKDMLEILNTRVSHNFAHTEIVENTKGMNPLPPDYWPGVDRCR